MLSDIGIQEALASGEIGITPLALDAVQPASVDLRIRLDDLQWPDAPYGREAWIGSKQDVCGLFLEPGAFLLASTVEIVRLDTNHAARIEGKSSWARQGLLVHITAGFIDPGFNGRITMELKSINSRRRLFIPEYSFISQLAIHRLDSAASRPYPGAYNGADGAQLAHEIRRQKP